MRLHSPIEVSAVTLGEHCLALPVHKQRSRCSHINLALPGVCLLSFVTLFTFVFRRYEALLAGPRWAALQKRSWKSMVQTLDDTEQFMTKQILVMSSVLKFPIEYKKSYVGFNQWLHEENQVFDVTLKSNLIVLTKKLLCRQSFSFFEHYLISLFYHQLLQIQSWIKFLLFGPSQRTLSYFVAGHASIYTTCHIYRRGECGNIYGNSWTSSITTPLKTDMISQLICWRIHPVASYLT